MSNLSSQDKQNIIDDFYQKVNLSHDELDTWLDTIESRSVGIIAGTTHIKKTSPDGGESVGHLSGKRILHILKTPNEHLDDDDYGHMKKVIGYIKRHTARIPEKADVSTSRWRYSLMNWGHDPLKK